MCGGIKIAKIWKCCVLWYVLLLFDRLAVSVNKSVRSVLAGDEYVELHIDRDQVPYYSSADHQHYISYLFPLCCGVFVSSSQNWDCSLLKWKLRVRIRTSGSRTPYIFGTYVHMPSLDNGIPCLAGICWSADPLFFSGIMLNNWNISKENVTFLLLFDLPAFNPPPAHPHGSDYHNKYHYPCVYWNSCCMPM